MGADTVRPDEGAVRLVLEIMTREVTEVVPTGCCQMDRTVTGRNAEGVAAGAPV